MSDEILKCFRLLDLKPEASPDEVRRAYRELVKVWHPDRFQNDSSLYAKAQEKLKEINLAYEQIQQFMDAPPPPTQEPRVPTGERQPHEEESVTDQFNKGVARYHAGDLNGAVDWFLKAAHRGMADAQFWVGKLYFHHRHFFPFMGHKHFEECLFWFTKAAEQGHAEAQYMVGYFHHGGFGTPYSAKEAKKWYALAAKQGHRKAKQRLTWYGFLWGYYDAS